MNTEEKLISFANWLETPAGVQLIALERETLEEVLPDLFGYHILQIGEIGNQPLISDSRVLHKSVLSLLSSEMASGYASACLSAEQWPIATDSVDVLVLPHLLEFVAEPHQVLREVDRVLVPEGHVVFTGLNPWSLIGLRKALSFRSRPQSPWQGSFISMSRLKDWLSLLGFDLTQTQNYFFSLPVQKFNLSSKTQFLEKLGSRFWNFFGGSYLVVARKRVVTLTPIRPAWKPARSLVSGSVVEPSSRILHKNKK